MFRFCPSLIYWHENRILMESNGKFRYYIQVWSWGGVNVQCMGIMVSVGVYPDRLEAWCPLQRVRVEIWLLTGSLTLHKRQLEHLCLSMNVFLGVSLRRAELQGIFVSGNPVQIIQDSDYNLGEGKKFWGTQGLLDKISYKDELQLIQLILMFKLFESSRGRLMC